LRQCLCFVPKGEAVFVADSVKSNPLAELFAKEGSLDSDSLKDLRVDFIRDFSGYGVGGFGVVVIINILLFCDPLYAVFQAFKGFDGCYLCQLYGSSG
jgi:hypothetical protein